MLLLHLVACLGKCHGMEMASPEGPPGCSLQCSPMVRCKDNCGTSSEGSGGEGPHWWCAFQVTFTVSVSHGVGSLYTLTSGTVQSFVRNKGFHSLSCLLHTCKWLDIDLTSDCLVSPFPNCVKDFISHLQAPRPTLGSGQSILFQAEGASSLLCGHRLLPAAIFANAATSQVREAAV